ncbi:MAG TPA: putative baseplate assembly protein [Candidatus Solibacter sp.]|nr:putative baseplate assembly protein [Candidatus Solibacter sp.]
MSQQPTPTLDARDAATILRRFWDRRYGYVPEWLPPDKTAGIAIAQVFSRMIYTILQRLNQAPAKNKLAFLDLVGLHLIPAQEARAPIVFQTSTPGSDSSAPAGTQLAAPPPPGSTDQIVFETEQATGIAAAKLRQVVSLWPGRDESIDHSADYLVGQAITLFQAADLQPTPHVLYLAHATYLAFAGASHLEVEFNLAQGSSSPLEILWQYWDGQVWRGFKSLKPNCLTAAEKGSDGTNGLTRSGSVRLDTDCAKTAQTTVNGIQSYWIRGQLTQPLPPNPEQLLPVAETMKLRTRIDQGLEEILTLAVQPAKAVLSVLSLVSGGAAIQTNVIVSSNTDGNFSTFQGTTDASGKLQLKQNFTQGKTYTFQVLDQSGANVASVLTIYYGVTGQAQQVSLDMTGALGADVTFTSLAQAGNVLTLTSDSGTPLEGALVTVSSPDDSAFPAVSRVTDAAGMADLNNQSLLPGKTYVVDVTLMGDEASAQFKYDGTTLPPLQITATWKVNGLRLDKAIAEGRTVDVTKPFFPFGQQPQPGAAFYFNQDEIFSKPGASVRVFVSRTISPQDKFQIGDAASEITLDHLVNWEYWNGFDWVPLPVSSESGGALDLDETDMVDFVVPKDMDVTTVNNQQALWMRVRLVSGGFGFTKEIVFNDGQGHSNNFTYVITRPPVLADFRLGYTWQTLSVAFEEVLSYNDFQYEDDTEKARWPGNPFLPYQTITEITPALYLGFDAPLPVSDIGLYLDVEEQSSLDQAPPMVWEYFNGVGWRELTVEDETRNLALPGILSFIAADDSVALPRFGTALHWVRGRLKEDGPPDETTLKGIFLNATWVSQRRTFTNTPLGASTGAPNQVFVFTQIPVLAGEQIEVQELSGARANVEWRILALELSQGDTTYLAKLEAALASEGVQTDIVQGNLRLTRDRNKRVVAAYVTWAGKPFLFDSGPNDRHYVLDQATGRLFFGDGKNGMIPPAGAAINARLFKSGGGLAGNLPANSITQMLGSIGGVQSVTNPRAAEGGADGESMNSYSVRAPQSIRHRGRAITPPDYETLAHEASAGVAIARAISGRDSAGMTRTGWITVVILPQSQEDRPVPSFGLREEIRLYLEARAPADIAAAHQIEVTGPQYLAIDVDATLAPKVMSEAGDVELRALAALAEFLHPLRGGPDGQGWDLGRGVYISDVARALGEVPGVDYVQDLSLSVNGNLQGDRVAVPDDHIVVAGTLRLKLVIVAAN